MFRQTHAVPSAEDEQEQNKNQMCRAGTRKPLAILLVFLFETAQLNNGVIVLVR